MEEKRRYLMSVQFTSKEINEMEKLLDSFLKLVEIRPNIPVDVFKFATALGFDVRGARFKDQLEGIVLVNEHLNEIEGFDSNKVIAYDCTKDIYSKKFIVAHELAHYISEKMSTESAKIVVAARDHANSYSDDRNEQRMDYIAASLLVPKNSLIDYLKENAGCTDEQIAERYKVSVELAKRRVKEVVQ